VGLPLWRPDGFVDSRASRLAAVARHVLSVKEIVMLLKIKRLTFLMLSLALLAGCSLDEKVVTPTPVTGLGAVDKDGSEALGAPLLDIAGGSGIVQGGISMIGVSAADLVVSVPEGAAIRQVLLYWAGGTTTVDGDGEISLDGVAVSGDLIGGPTWFFYDAGSNYYFSAYRADITDLGLVGPGTNTLTVSDFNFGVSVHDENDGASILVILDDGTSSEITLRDGLDMAYFGFSGLLNATVPQVFPVTPAAADRIADLVILAGSVGENRPNRIVVTTSAGEQTFDDPMGGFDGPQWDSLTLPVTVPAGDTSLTVELISPVSYSPLGASLAWVCAGLVVPTPVVEPGNWNVSGTVFLDTDRDGMQSPIEIGLPGVVVDLSGAGAALSAITDADGRYTFANVGTGSWTVAIDLTAHADAFNADLAAWFLATSPLTQVVTVGPDAPGNDFGFVPDTGSILEDLADGTIRTDGYTRETWRRIFRCAMHYDQLANPGGNDDRGRSDHDDGERHEDSPGHRVGDSCACNDGDLVYDANALRALLASVEGLFLPEPYQFRDGQELREAYRLLARRENTIEGRVEQELLVTELNYLVGRGAVGQADLIAAIAAWSESLLVWDATEVVKSADKGRATTDLREVLTILEAVNTGGGGGVDE